MGSNRKPNHIFSIAAIAVLVFLIFFAPAFGWKIRQFLSPVPASHADDQNLTAENEALKAQLAELQLVSTQLPSQPANDIRAMVYSRYPFNFKNEFLVNAGTDQGVRQGAAVIFQGVLIGKVEQTSSETAVVETVFDNDIKIPVRIGSSGYDGLLQGGAYPTVGSITNDASLTTGDIVYSAAQGLPYDLPIGTVAATSTSADSLFQTATLNFSYDLNNIETVFITQ
jgi:rod shape-determining protein MreC